jgi:hypothetical protein
MYLSYSPEFELRAGFRANEGCKISTKTHNGKTKLVVQDAESYQKLLDWIEQLETIAGIKRGLKDIEPCRTRPFEEFGQEMLQK